MQNLIKELTKVGKKYFGNGFSYKEESNAFIAKSDNMSSAINYRKSDSFGVKVFYWFDDFWLFNEVKFTPNLRNKKSFPNTFYTLSVFQGEYNDAKKTQLFRAEWDNFNTEDVKHSQPHWHIYPHKYKSEVQTSFEDFIKSGKNDRNFHDFIENNQVPRKDIIEINEFHFAMSALWHKGKSDVHRLESVSDLCQWFEGLLNHIKSELEYVRN